VTYNFDPEKWYENQRRLLEAQYANEPEDSEALAAALEELEKRYDELVARMDHPFDLPGSGSK
jgi:phage shock protein A